MRWLALFLLGGLLVTSAAPAQADGARGRRCRRPVVVTTNRVPVYGYPAYPAYPNRPAASYGHGYVYPGTGIRFGVGNVQISVGTGYGYQYPIGGYAYPNGGYNQGCGRR